LQAPAGVSGFAVFQYESASGVQEAAVPLETRNANSYVLAYDDTNGCFNGVAVANTSTGSASITVTLRDAATGKITSADSITLPAQGHKAFLLRDRFPSTQGTAGTIAFSTPAGVSISVLGLRFNSNAAFTSIPAMAKK
jgi:hypothetical protein